MISHKNFKNALLCGIYSSIALVSYAFLIESKTLIQLTISNGICVISEILFFHSFIKTIKDLYESIFDTDLKIKDSN